MSNKKIQQVLKILGLHSELRFCLRDGNFPTNFGILNLYPGKGKHWVCIIEYPCFDS